MRIGPRMGSRSPSTPDPARIPALVRTRPPRSRTVSLVRGALLVALLAASALITIPLGPVPFTAQTLVVMVIALVCTPRQAALVMGVYLAVGAVGMPVFSGARGGVALLVGPTGGYLVGFAAGAAVGAAAREALGGALRALPWIGDPTTPGGTGRISRGGRRGALADAVAVVIVLVLTYALGVAWLAHSTGSTLGAAAAGGVLPFLPADGIKALGALAVARVLRRAGLADVPVC